MRTSKLFEITLNSKQIAVKK